MNKMTRTTSGNQKIRKNKAGLYILFLCLILLPVIFSTGCWKHEEKLYRDAYSSWQNRDYETAIIKYLKLIETNPRSKYAPFSQYQIGNIYNRDLGRYQDAVVAYQKTVSNYPDSELAFEAQFEIAEIYNNRFQEKRQAIIEYERLLRYRERKDRFPGIYFKIIDCYIELGEYDKAIYNLRQLKSECPGYKNMDYIMYKEALIIYQKGDLQNAKDLFEKFFKNYPDSVFFLKAKFWYAQTLEELNKLDLALEYYTDLKDNGYKPEIINTKIESVKKQIEEDKKKTR